MDKAYDELTIEYFSRYDYRREAWASTREVGDLNDFPQPSDEEMNEAGWRMDEYGYWQHPENSNSNHTSEPDPEIPF